MPAIVQDAAEICNFVTVGLSQFARTYRVPMVKEILEIQDRATWRLRKLPAELMFFFPLLMALDRSDSATDTMLKLLEGNKTLLGWAVKDEPGKGGISQARIRLGFEPLKEAFERVCVPLAREPHSYTHYAGMPMFAFDGCSLNVLDTEANAEFGRPGNQHEHSIANPQVKVVALVECGTHAVVGLEVGGYRDGEIPLAHEVLRRLPANSLVFADRLFLGWKLVNRVRSQGADLVWRIKANQRESRFELGERLQDGSYRAIYLPPNDPKTLKRLEGTDLTPVQVRLFAYELEKSSQPVYLVTTLLDETIAPALKLAELYTQRWEIELVFKEMKVCLNDNEQALRSQRPDLVKQELYGLVMAHYAIRSLMYEAALGAKLDPDRISFKGAVKTVNRTLLKSSAFSP
jgi:Transposase DDE domain/Insertion element 4 transposase N-terminal